MEHGRKGGTKKQQQLVTMNSKREGRKEDHGHIDQQGQSVQCISNLSNCTLQVLVPWCGIDLFSSADGKKVDRVTARVPLRAARPATSYDGPGRRTWRGNSLEDE